MIDTIFMRHIGFDNLGQCVGVYNFVKIQQFSIWKCDIGLVGFMQMCVFGIFIYCYWTLVTPLWNFKSQTMLNVVPYITQGRSCNCWSIFCIDVVHVNCIYHGWIFWSGLKMIKCTTIKVEPYLSYCQNLSFKITSPFFLVKMCFTPFIHL